MSLYEQINEEEILFKDLKTPEHFPALYIDENDSVYCYLGIIDKDRIMLKSSPYYLSNKKSSEIKNYIRGYFMIKNGAILATDMFLDEKKEFYNNAKCKIIPAIIHFPQPQDVSYAIYTKNNKDLDNELTRKVFGLTYEELNELIIHFNNVFEIRKTYNYYNKYPSITRYIKNDNYCDISNLWIPPEYPYIAFKESDYLYSHISLYGFYQNIQFITNYNLDSITSKKMLENGLNKEILENLFKIKNNIDYGDIKITRDYFFKLLDESTKKDF